METEKDYKYDGEDEQCHFEKSKVKATIKGGISIPKVLELLHFHWWPKLFGVISNFKCTNLHFSFLPTRMKHKWHNGFSRMVPFQSVWTQMRCNFTMEVFHILSNSFATQKSWIMEFLLSDSVSNFCIYAIWLGLLVCLKPRKCIIILINI